MEHKADQSDVITGFSARLYNFVSNVIGLGSVRKRTLSFINIGAGALLDLGCGTGRLLEEVRRKCGKNIELYGIDPSPDMVQIAQKRTGNMNVHIKLAYGSDLPFIDNNFDFLVSSLAFHHMDTKEKKKTISEIKRTLKTGGTLLITDLGRGVGIWGKLMEYLNRSHSFTKGNINTLESALRAHNFEKIGQNRQFGYIEHLIFKKN